MRLTRVRIEGFRGIRRLDMGVDQVTAVVGENNHGKTSLFDALGAVLGRAEPVAGRILREEDVHRADGGEAHTPIVVTLTFAGADGLHPDFAWAARRSDGDPTLAVCFEADPDTRRVRAAFLDQEGRRLDDPRTDAGVETLRRLHPALVLRFADGSRRGPGHADARAGDRGERRERRVLEAEIERLYRALRRGHGTVAGSELGPGLEAAHRLHERLRRRHPSRHGPVRRVLDQLAALVEDTGEGDRAALRPGSGTQVLGTLLVLGAILEGRGGELLPRDAMPLILIEDPEVHLHPILLASTWEVIEDLRAQTLVTTNSSELLSSVPLNRIRRFVRRDGRVDVFALQAGTLSAAEFRRVRYHISAKRGAVLFARCWLLVEGESEFWILRRVAEVLGFDLDAEGVHIVEFAQCGVAPLVKLANDLEIRWHLLVDGDASGAGYAKEAGTHLQGAPAEERISRLPRPDIEQTFWSAGYEDVYRNAAHRDARRRREVKSRGVPAARVIAKAARARSKPYLAQLVGDEMAARGPDAIPEPLPDVVRTAVRLAREAMGDELA